MSKHDATVTLNQIADHAREVCALCEGRTLEELMQSWRDTKALERGLEVLGEAVKRLPDELRGRYPTVPWRQMAGMRDRLIHGYDRINYEVLWNTVRDDLPSLLATVEEMRRDLEDGERQAGGGGDS
jgi:uncharacterized protein with HEPN domain